MGTVVLGIRLVLAAVFAVAGVAKLFDRNGSRQALADFGVPAPAVPVAAWLLPLVELATAIALIPPSSARWGALAALVLLLGFVAGIANALRRGKDVDCGCFGKLYSAVAGRGTLVRNAALAVGAGIVLWQGPGPSIGDWVSARTAAELVAIAAVAAAALVLGVVIVRLWRERRDLREDVDKLREQLGAVPSGLSVGAVAPAFALSDLHGETHTLESLCARGRPVVLIFIPLGSGISQELLPELGRWQAALADRLTVAVIAQGTAEFNRPAAEEHGIAMLLDPGLEVAPAYLVWRSPSAVVVTPDGTIASPVVSSTVEVEPLVRLTLRRAAAAAGAGPASAGPASAEPTLS